jgi:uncharacterized membrane protein
MWNGAASSETVIGPASNLVRIRRRVGSDSAAKIRSSAGADVRADGKLTIGLTIGHSASTCQVRRLRRGPNPSLNEAQRMRDTALPHGHEHMLRRLEAFSDIVIAFSLSELAFSLQVPASATEIFIHPARYLAFVASFGVICSIWWLHNRLFAYFFVADAVGIVLNFVLLSAVVMVGFALQLFFRFEYEPIAVASYAFSLGLLYGLIAILYAKGFRDPRLTVEAEIRREAVGRARRCAIVSVVFLGSLAAYHWGSEAMELCWLAFIPAIGVLRLVQRRQAG